MKMTYEGADVRDAVAFAIEHGDNCRVLDGYADQGGWEMHEDDWLSDWGAFMADHVLKELVGRGYMIVRRAGHEREITPQWVTDYEKRLLSEAGPSSGIPTEN